MKIKNLLFISLIQKKSSGGLNAWIIAAIALACVAAVVAVIIGIIVARKRKGQNPIPADSSIAMNNQINIS